MGLQDKITDIVKKAGTVNLSSSEKRKVKKVVIELLKQTDRLSEHDIASWRMACQRAIDIENPNRCFLYDIYNDVELDLHLSGGIGQVNGFVKCRSFKLTKEDGETDEEAIKYFNTQWFKELIDYILESIYWGHSLIELGDIITDANGRVAFSGVKLIPRKHVIPEYHRVVKNASDQWKSGIDYHDSPYCDYLIEAGKSHDLGLYKKAAMQTIPKKYAMAFWDTFAEMFGIPIRIAKSSVRSETERKKLAKMMDDMGGKAWAVLDEQTDIDIVESSKGDAFNVYDKRIERANSELSKLILQQTMTIDDGSSYSQSNTHLKVFKNLIESYCDMIRDVVNNQLLPKMVRHGFPVAGLTFDWDDPVDYTPEQQLDFEQFIANNYEVPGEYFEKKYGVPAGDRRDNPMLQMMSLIPNHGGSQQTQNQSNNKTKDKNVRQQVENFFD